MMGRDAMSFSNWHDEIYERLYQQRTFSVAGFLDDARATHTAAGIWSLDASGDAPIRILFSCEGGTTRAALALVDAIAVVGIDVLATCVGQLSGPPIAAYAAATTRYAAEHARFALRDETVSLAGSASELAESARLHLDERHALAAHLSDATRGRRSVGDVLVDLDRRLTLSAAEAVDYGLVDEVVSSSRRGRPPEPPRFGFQPNR
jgi:ATP-dependent Clp protease protease subunit